MSVLAMIAPTTLVGQEIRDALEKEHELWSEMRLLSASAEEVGTLVDLRGGAGIVQELEAGSLEGVDLVFACGPEEGYPGVLDALPAGVTAIVVGAESRPESGRPVVAGVNLERAERGEVLLSPHPAAVALALLLAPLAALGLEQAVATVVQPASMRDKRGLDELFEQTRRVLAFAGERPEEVFGTQLAFNLLPTPRPAAPVVELLGELLDPAPELSVEVVQGGIFHGTSISLYLRFAAAPGLEAVRDALADARHVLIEDDDALLGPIDAAARDEVLVGEVRRDGERGVRLWSVSDNLTRGGALNALAIARRVLGAG